MHKTVPIKGPRIDNLLTTNRFYVKVVVPTEMLPNFANPSDTEIIGVRASLVASSQVSERAIYQVAKEVFGHLDHYKNRYPATVKLNQRDLAESLAAPPYPGVATLFRELQIKPIVFK